LRGGQYWGAGVHLGYLETGTWYAPKNYTGGIFGPDGVFGVEYTFDEIPINVSVDILSGVNIGGYLGWNGISSGITIRYVFDFSKHHRTY
jgi:hypothetical protein